MPDRGHPTPTCTTPSTIAAPVQQEDVEDQDYERGGPENKNRNGENYNKVPRNGCEKMATNGSGKNNDSAPIDTVGPRRVSKAVKLVLLVVLCLQNAVYTMLRRYRYSVGWVAGQGPTD